MGERQRLPAGQPYWTCPKDEHRIAPADTITPGDERSHGNARRATLRGACRPEVNVHADLAELHVLYYPATWNRLRRAA
jgi:hypothetical protein